VATEATPREKAIGTPEQSRQQGDKEYGGHTVAPPVQTAVLEGGHHHPQGVDKHEDRAHRHGHVGVAHGDVHGGGFLKLDDSQNFKAPINNHQQKNLDDQIDQHTTHR
jgi:hypothetical protein